MGEVIRLAGVKKLYNVGGEEVRALNGIDIMIRSNEYVAVMGPSGSGKSTMMNILGCLDTPTEGEFIINGNDVSIMDDNELARIRNNEIGFVFQSFNLLPRYNAVDNVALPLVYSGIAKSIRKERAERALTAVGLGERLCHKPNELSGGQKQRVAIARALINDPAIILADEPTGNLDTKSSEDIMILFERIYRDGNTVIVVTHEEDIARYARRVIRLRDGIVESDETNYHPILA